MTTHTSTMDGFDRRGQEAAAPGALVLVYARELAEIPAATPVDGSLVVGREPPPGGLRVPQAAASRIHARIERRANRFRVVDLDSRNGVLVNGRFVRDAELAHRDVVRIGDAIFVFVVEDAASYAPYRIDGARSPAAAPTRVPSLVGGRRIRTLEDELARVAPSPLSVLILGETGTGKEVVADALHRLSGRSGRFVALNCAAVPSNLLESELFGFRRGAFTGAERDHLGLVRGAHGGTLFLDEIGDMPLEAQAKVLRLLETRQVVPLGGTDAVRVDVRVVCATHKDLDALVAQGQFRGDLLARVNGYAASLPPLRERKEDLYLLTRHFLTTFGRPDAVVTLPFMVAVCQYDWPYNVRELAQAVQRALAVSGGGEALDAAHLPDAVRACMTAYGTRAAAAASEAPPRDDEPARRRGAPGEAELRAVLAEESGNVAAVARRFGKDRTQIHRWLRLYDLAPDDFRKA